MPHPQMDDAARMPSFLASLRRPPAQSIASCVVMVTSVREPNNSAATKLRLAEHLLLTRPNAGANLHSSQTRTLFNNSYPGRPGELSNQAGLSPTHSEGGRPVRGGVAKPIW